jgi:hypothetical protein
VDGDGTETGVEVCLACEPNSSDGCSRENLLHARRVRSQWAVVNLPARGIGPVLPHVAPVLRSRMEKI